MLGRSRVSTARIRAGSGTCWRRALAPRRQLENLFAITVGGNVIALELHDALLPAAPAPTRRASCEHTALAGGTDGGEPGAGGLRAGARRRLPAWKTSRSSPRPAAAAYADARRRSDGALIAHAEARRAYRIAVLDTPPRPDARPGARRCAAASIRRYAALYYPWVVVANPLARPGRDDIPREIALPPSGFVCGIYARNDIERGVLQGAGQRGRARRAALRERHQLGAAGGAQPDGVNCLRFFAGRGNRVWGARTVSSRSRVEVRQRAPLLHLPRALDRPRHAVGGVRAERRAAVGQRPRRRSRTSSTTSGATARCSAPRRRRRSSCAATAPR